MTFGTHDQPSYVFHCDGKSFKHYKDDMNQKWQVGKSTKINDRTSLIKRLKSKGGSATPARYGLVNQSFKNVGDLKVSIFLVT